MHASWIIFVCIYMLPQHSIDLKTASKQPCESTEHCWDMLRPLYCFLSSSETKSCLLQLLSSVARPSEWSLSSAPSTLSWELTPRKAGFQKPGKLRGSQGKPSQVLRLHTGPFTLQPFLYSSIFQDLNLVFGFDYWAWESSTGTKIENIRCFDTLSLQRQERVWWQVPIGAWWTDLRNPGPKSTGQPPCSKESGCIQKKFHGKD